MTAEDDWTRFAGSPSATPQYLRGALGVLADRSGLADTTRARALPPQRYARLIEIADAAALIGPEREFRAGLDIVTAGLTAS